MYPKKCPGCGVKLGNYLYADACPHCRESLKSNLVCTPLRATVAKVNSWPVHAFLKIRDFVES